MVTSGPAARVRWAALVWALAGCAIAASGLAEAHLLSDDAYYYFEIARNAVRGAGVSFDSLAPTNGFHPLWAALLAGVFALFGDAYWLPIRIALGLSVLCVAGTGVLVQSLCARLGAPRSGELAAYAWLLNPFTLALGFRGMETPLACLLLAASLVRLVGMRLRRAGSARDFAVLGGLLGACALARTDAVLWALSVGCVVAWDLLRAGRARELAPRGLVAALAALAVLSPWLAWNLLSFGTIVQSSQQAKLMFDLYGSLPALAADAGPTRMAAGAVNNVLLALLVPVRFVAGEEFGELRRGAVFFWMAALWVVGVAAVGLRGLGRPPDDPVGARTRHAARVLLAPLALFLLLHFGVYVLAIGSYATWYFLPVVLATCLLQGVAFAGAEALPARRYAAVAAGYAASLAALGAVLCAPLFGRHPPERTRQLAELGEHLAEGTAIGLWNAGEVGYFFSHRFPGVRVINLDGVVNNELVRLEKEGRYEEYVLEHVDLLIESPQPYLVQVIGSERAMRFLGHHLRPGQPRGDWPVLEVVRRAAP